MEITTSAQALRAVTAPWRRERKTIALVPTMGNLHAGHYALIDQARSVADQVVASVFVNPTQFGPNEDFASYPRTPHEDIEGLRARGCDLLFAPDVATVYPLGVDRACRVSVPTLTDVLCGAHRPGHFDGVATVVSRLFNLVAPDVALFGEKDFQQLRILERMTVDLGYDIAIVRGATVRDEDGLALSSRNRYLDVEQRERAPIIRATLLAMAASWQRGRSPAQVEAEGRTRLDQAGFDVDYLDIRDDIDLARASGTKRDGNRIFVAARIGTTRLIDNLALPG